MFACRLSEDIKAHFRHFTSLVKPKTSIFHLSYASCIIHHRKYEALI